MSNQTNDTEHFDTDQIPQDPTPTQNLFTPERLRFNNENQQFEALFPGRTIDQRLENILYTVDEITKTAIVVYPPGGISADRPDLMIDSYRKIMEYQKRGYTKMSYQPHDATIPPSLKFATVPREAMRLGFDMVRQYFGERFVVVTTSLNVINNLTLFFDSMVVVDSNNPLDGLDFIGRYKQAIANPNNKYDSPKELYTREMLNSPVTIMGPRNMAKYKKGLLAKPATTPNSLLDQEEEF